MNDLVNTGRKRRLSTVNDTLSYIQIPEDCVALRP